MKFPWGKYEEIKTDRRNTLQIFVTNKCNLNCNGCFARNVIKGKDKNISIKEYKEVVLNFINKGGKQITLLGGEPLLHPYLKDLLNINREYELKTTIYTNGTFINNYCVQDFKGIKIRVSIYSAKNAKYKSVFSIPCTRIDFDGNFMVSRETELEDLMKASSHLENFHNCKVFFISSLRELDNSRQEFFDDTDLTMPILKYKELVHEFLDKYNGNMEINISKRGVFESTRCIPVNKCNFANYFMGGKIIQCPYDVVNLKYQKNYEFNKRFCQHNSSCLMSKVIYKRIKK
jgi:organic radical activating enzyme